MKRRPRDKTEASRVRGDAESSDVGRCRVARSIGDPLFAQRRIHLGADPFGTLHGRLRIVAVVDAPQRR